MTTKKEEPQAWFIDRPFRRSTPEGGYTAARNYLVSCLEKALDSLSRCHDDVVPLDAVEDVASAYRFLGDHVEQFIPHVEAWCIVQARLEHAIAPTKPKTREHVMMGFTTEKQARSFLKVIEERHVRTWPKHWGRSPEKLFVKKCACRMIDMVHPQAAPAQRSFDGYGNNAR